MTDEQVNEAIGQRLIEWLALRVKPNGRVDTSWGDKTPQGLGASVRRIIDETQQASEPQG